MSTILAWLSSILLISGGVLTLLGSIGLLRMPDFFTRMHAAGITDTMGAGAILLGLVINVGWSLLAAKLIIIFLFLVLTNPSASHALARSAMFGQHDQEHDQQK